MLHHKGGQLGVQFTEYGHVAVTHLVQHRDHRSLAKGGIVGSLQRTDVRDITVVADGIVVDVVSHLLNQTVIADSHIPQRRVVDTRVLEETLGHLHLLIKLSQADVTIEDHAMEIIRFEAICHHHTIPILCPADIVL